MNSFLEHPSWWIRSPLATVTARTFVQPALQSLTVTQRCMQPFPVLSCPRIMPACVVRGCVPVSGSSTSGFSHHHSTATHYRLRQWETKLAYPWKLHACKVNNNYFLYLLYKIICYTYLVSFSIELYRKIVTVFTDNICLYNYLRQMYQIIQLSLEECLSSARSKSVKKYSEV